MEDDRRLEGQDRTLNKEAISSEQNANIEKEQKAMNGDESKRKKQTTVKKKTKKEDESISKSKNGSSGKKEEVKEPDNNSQKKSARKKGKKRKTKIDSINLNTEEKNIVLGHDNSHPHDDKSSTKKEDLLPSQNGENGQKLVMPDKVQVKVKQTDYPGESLPKETLKAEFNPNLFKIKVVGENEGVEEVENTISSQGTNSNIPMNLQGAQVKIGEARRRVAPIVQPTQLPVPAIKVRNITGEIVNVTTEVIKDKVIVQGVIHKQVFFVSADGVVRHFSEDVPFSTFIDIPGAEVGMNVQVHPIIEKILFHLTDNGLFVNQKIILEIFIKVTEFIQTGLILGEGPLLLLPLVIGEGTKQSLVENIVTLDMPAIKVDEIRGELRNIEAEIIPDKVIIQGIIHKQIFYVDTDNLARHQAEDVQFSLFIDIPGAEPGMDLQVHPIIEGIFFELLSPTELRQKVVIEIFVKVTEAIQESVVVGQGPLFKVEQVINQDDKQILNESTIELDRPAIKIREIVGEVRNVTAEIIPDKVVIQGILHKQIFYIGTDNIEYHQAEDVPFSLFIDIPGASPGLNARVKIIIEKILFQLINETTLQQKVILKANVIVTETVQLPLEIGDFSLFKLEQVIGEGIRQILVERRQEVPPIPPIVRNVVVVEIVPPAEVITARQQIIVENVVELPETAIKIREVRGEIIDLRARLVTDNGVLIDGFVHKQVFFVGEDNIVRSINENVPFTILVNIPGITPETPFTVDVQIEKISFTLSPDGDFLRQIIVLEAEVTAETPAPEPFQVVSEVTGPGITTERVLVRAPVLTETGVEVQEFFVVTAVSGPGIRRVETAVVMLDVVNDGNPNPVPIEVVTDVEFEPVVF